MSIVTHLKRTIRTEPVPEDRFNSTHEALTQLRSEIPAIQPLVGSSIQIDKKFNKLIIRIPPKRKLDLVQTEVIVWFVLTVIVEIFFLAKFGRLLPLRFVNVILLGNLLYVPKLIDLAFAFFGQVSLKITSEKF